MKELKKPFLIGIISLGTLLEWAEYTFYGYMAITLSQLFFPESDLQVGILKTFGIFAAGYLMRPLGGIVFGYWGDRWGRKEALMISLFLMGVATVGIGLLPTYTTLGAKASLILLLLRLVQGIAISGEYNGAGIFLIEKNTSAFACLAGSWVSASAAAGMVVGGMAAFIVSLPSMPIWAWRVPFLLGGLSCFMGLWLRQSVTESTAFLTAKSTPLPRSPLLTVFKQYKKELLMAMAMAALTGIYVYIGNIFMVVFLKQQALIPTHYATFFTIFGEAIVVFAIPAFAYLADLTDPYRLYRLGLWLIALLCPIIFLLAASAYYPFILLAMVIYGILNGVACGPMVKILCDQFPLAVRYSGISFAWGLAAAIFSGTAPIVAQYLSQHVSGLWGPSLYVSSAALITLFLVANLKKAPSDLSLKTAIFSR